MIVGVVCAGRCLRVMLTLMVCIWVRSCVLSGMVGRESSTWQLCFEVSVLSMCAQEHFEGDVEGELFMCRYVYIS